MDQNTINSLVAPDPSDPTAGWAEGDAWLAGGTFLLSLQLPHLKRFRDLTLLNWEPVAVSPMGLEIAATCTVAQLYEFSPPSYWESGPLLRECVEAFLAGFKVWNGATVGGNICTSIPAGPMTTLACALEAEYTLIGTDGSERVVPAISFVTGNNENILMSGEYLRKINFTNSSLHSKYALRRFSLTKAGRSSIFLVGAVNDNKEFLLTVTAATIHPVQVRLPAMPSGSDLREALDEAIADELYFDDPNGRPDHRKHLTYVFAEEIRVELANSCVEGEAL